MKKLNLRFWRNPRFRYGGLSTLLLCLCLALLIALNGLFTALEKKHGWRVDFSFNALTTHSEDTVAILDQLTEPVHIYALFERGDEDLPLMELLNRYAAASPMVTWEHAPASLNPTLLTRFASTADDAAISSDSLVVYCASTDRFRVLSPADFVSLAVNADTGAYTYNWIYESSITSAIVYVTQETIPVVYAIQGHDELNADTSAVFADLLLTNHFDLRYSTIADADLGAAELLIFLAPVRDLTDSEMALVSEYVLSGGNLLFACDYSDPITSMPNYQALLRSYGFLPLEGVVLAAREEKDTYFEGNRTMILPKMESTEVTYSMMIGGMDTLMLPYARAFEIPAESDANLTVTPMLTSSENAYLRPLSSTSVSLQKQEGDRSGPFALALEARRYADGAENISKAVVIGNTTLLTSDYIHSMTHAQEFIISVMNYLADSAAGHVNIMARTAIRPQLSAESISVGSLMLVAIPLIVLAAAFIILYPRRHM